MQKKLIKCMIKILPLILIVSLTVLLYARNHYKKHYTTYLVQEGDTLWSIAKEFQPSKDPRQLIYQIQHENNITPMIYPGQKIKVPTE